MSKGKENIYNEFGRLRGRVSKLETARDRQVVRDLEKRKPGLDSYSYTYKEISYIHNVSESHVQRLAVKYDITRR